LIRNVPHAHGCTPARLSEDLAERGATMRLSELHAATRDLLRAENLEVKEGALDRFTSVADVVERFEGNKHSAGTEGTNV
jgi:hypothetical protein